MTLAEIMRAIESKARVIQAKDKKRANFDYILADLIGISVARVHNSRNKMPPIHEVYPSLFEIQEEDEAEKQDELSALRFKLFAQSFNKRFENNEEVRQAE